MKRARYIEWFSADEMHEHSKEWLSELSFIKDEILFLQSLAAQITIKAVVKRDFQTVQKFDKELQGLRDQLNLLTARVKKHMGQLEIMLDDVDQLEMEKAYRKTHKKLFKDSSSFFSSYRKTKEKLFKLLTKVLKTNKLMTGLANPEYKIAKKKNEKQHHEKS